jgi:hypothetical protein
MRRSMPEDVKDFTPTCVVDAEPTPTRDDHRTDEYARALLLIEITSRSERMFLDLQNAIIWNRKP